MLQKCAPSAPSAIVLLMTMATCSAMLYPAIDRDGARGSGEAAARPEMPALFDFSRYQQLFAKHYHSHLEAVTRRVYFLASAFKVYVSGVAYKFWRRSYYLALNDQSDKSPQELDLMDNEAQSGLPTRGALMTSEPVERDEAKVEELADELEHKIGQALEAGEPFETRHRKKRDAPFPVDEILRRSPRRLSTEQLIKSEPAAPKPLPKRPKSNNPHYDPLALEPPTMGLTKADQEEVAVFTLEKRPTEKSILDLFGSWYGADRRAAKAAPAGPLPDETFVDLRKSGCLSEPRVQGLCGSCYAFSTVAMMEYLHCNQTGELVAFSEQYMMDCGRAFVEGIKGCRGGAGWSPIDFIHNFGMELAQNYPYTGREGRCPYSEDTDLKSTGYIRLEIGAALRIPTNRWAEYIKWGPMYVVLSTHRDFHHYGGGVHDGLDCPPGKNNHAMALVGHGREDGQEYWLFRNSYGANWGEGGYFKLSTKAPAHCIEMQFGYALGTADGKQYIRPRRNERHGDAVARRYLASLERAAAH